MTTLTLAHEDWGNLSEDPVESINKRLADIEAGKVVTHEKVKARIYMKLKSFRVDAKRGKED